MRWPFSKRLDKGFVPSGYQSGVNILHQPNSYVNFDVEAGKRYDNSVVLAAINWKSDQITEARIRVEQLSGEKWVDAGRRGVFGDVLKVIEQPNPWYSGSVLLRGTLLSWDVSGNAYAIKLQTNGGKTGGLLWYPPSCIRPASDDGAQLITHYEYTPVNGYGSWKRIERQEVVHLRYGLDPKDSRLGLSRLGASLREIATENEVAQWLFAVLRNKAVPGMLVSPKASEDRSTPEQLKQTVAYLREFVRDRRGEPGMMPVPIDVMTPAWSPQELDLAAIRSMPITSICAALGIHPMVLNYESDAATFSNMAEAIDSAGKRTILPMLREWAGGWSTQLLPDFGLDPSQFRISWDLSGVSWLQDEADELHARVREDFKSGIIDRYRAKEMIGEKPDPGDRGLTYFAMSAPQLPIGPKALTKSPPKAGGADLQTRHDRLIGSFRRDMEAHVRAFDAGDLDGAGLEDAMLGSIERYHAKAYALGLDLAGTDGDGEDHGKRMADLESFYVRGFRDRMETKSERYYKDGALVLDGSLGADLDLYAYKAGGSANSGFVDGSDDGAEFDWVLGGTEDHCEDCPYIAEGSPYTKETLYTKPREGQTPCLSNCLCHLVRSDGVRGFGPVS